VCLEASIKPHVHKKIHNYFINMAFIIELSVKYSKESTKTLCLLKIKNKVVEVEWINNKDSG
jgi:hypothetical protein